MKNRSNWGTNIRKIIQVVSKSLISRTDLEDKTKANWKNITPTVCCKQPESLSGTILTYYICPNLFWSLDCKSRVHYFQKLLFRRLYFWNAKPWQSANAILSLHIKGSPCFYWCWATKNFSHRHNRHTDTLSHWVSVTFYQRNPPKLLWSQVQLLLTCFLMSHPVQSWMSH